MTTRRRDFDFCSSCRSNPKKVDECRKNETVTVFTDGEETLHTIPYDGKLGEHCPYCYVSVGKKHHNACHEEICPKCAGKLWNCVCSDYEHHHRTLEDEEREYALYKMIYGD